MTELGIVFLASLAIAFGLGVYDVCSDRFYRFLGRELAAWFMPETGARSCLED